MTWAAKSQYSVQSAQAIEKLKTVLTVLPYDKLIGSSGRIRLSY